jgi:predicted nucleic acid-binding protein
MSSLAGPHELTVTGHDDLVLGRIAALRAGAITLRSKDLQHRRRSGDLVIENPFRDSRSTEDDQ